MDIARKTDQATCWAGPGGRGWAQVQELSDAVLKPFEEVLLEACQAARAKQVLDVGCGAGGTTLAVARLLGTKGRCVGIDISEALIAAARARAERESMPVSFVQADAQIYSFDPPCFDMIISRFGVMFFADPVRAFANLRHAARPGAGLCMVAWRSAAENPIMTTAERAASSLLPNLPSRVPDAPGQFAFADRRRVHAILEESGWACSDILPIDVACSLPEKDWVRYLISLGPVGRALQEADDDTRRRVIECVRPAFDPYVHAEEVRFTAACWMIRARAPGPQS